MNKKKDAHLDQTQAGRLVAEAGRLFAMGQVQEAESILQGLVDQDPREKSALVALGIIAAQTGRVDLAISRLSHALDVEPNCSSTLCWMSHILLQNDQVDAARIHAERAVSADPSNAATNTALARCLVSKGLYMEAIPCFQKATDLDPNNPTVLAEFADALLALRLWVQAKEMLNRAVLIAPDPHNLLKLAYLELRLGKIDDAERYCRRVLRKEPELAAAHLLMARILTEKLGLDEADIHWRRAAELDETPGFVNLEKALSLSAIGQFEDAIQELKQSIEFNPNQGDAYQVLVFAKRIVPDDLPLVRQMESLISHDSLPANDRLNLLYSLGKSYDNLGEYETAIDYFDRANELRKRLEGSRTFDRSAFKSLIDARMRLFTKEFFAKRKDAGLESGLPILIVGMMRSGTTLIEQMLSCHPSVGGAGEQDYWGANEVLRADTLNTSRLRANANEYVNLLTSMAPGFPRVVDKNPANLEYLGSIHLALPNARIVYIRRNPIDTALSIWMTPMNTTAEFVSEREDIVYAFREFERLMDHWREVLPEDRFMKVHYEDLVAHPDVEMQRIVEFCGLDWDEACLHPDLNKRRVRTPSLWQVRQPIYKSSTERWKKYEPWLGVFEELREVC